MGGNRFLYLPNWAKFVSIAILSVSLIFGIQLILNATESNAGSNIVFAGTAIVQMSATALAGAVILFFSERAISPNGLLLRSDAYLTEDISHAIGRLEALGGAHDGNPAKISLKVVHTDGSYGAIYSGYLDTQEFAFRVTLNVYAIRILFYIADEYATGSEDFRERFSDFFSDASRFGFELEERIEVEEYNRRRHHNIYAYRFLGEGFLFDSEKRLATAQQIARLLRALCLQAHRFNLSTDLDTKRQKGLGRRNSSLRISTYWPMGTEP